MTSLFAWHGGREQAAEHGVLLKTTVDRLEAAMARLAELHPYDTPAIAGWPVKVPADMLSWLTRETRSA